LEPLPGRAALEAESKPIFRFRSYHRTGAESYYAGKPTCKGWNEVFLQFFYSVGIDRVSLWQAKSARSAGVDTNG
jgi:hypothetical protein